MSESLSTYFLYTELCVNSRSLSDMDFWVVWVFFFKVCTFFYCTVLLWVATSKTDSCSLSFAVGMKTRLVCIRPLMKLRNTKSGWPDCLGSKIESNEVKSPKEWNPLLRSRHHLENRIVFSKSALNFFINWLLHFADGWISSGICAAVCGWHTGV